jgi:hypothetical protein
MISLSASCRAIGSRDVENVVSRIERAKPTAVFPTIETIDAS